ncbi:MAG: family 16 glycosylhydrolase [Bacteroidetes bacterium]|nr:family 16 glycosylhydrolase [Bacteroidota bacterium]MBL0018504.1 family 16 glycosylhydrolase [Bacteroidota bacterium]
MSLHNRLLLLIAIFNLYGLIGYANGWQNRILPINLFAIYGGICPEPDQYVQVIRDDFDQGSLDHWLWDPTLNGTHHGEKGSITDEYNTENSFQFLPANNGTLRIQVTDDPIYAMAIPWELPNYPLEYNRTNLRIWPYQSGAMTSRWKFDKGRYVLRCQIPSGKNMWPAFWLSGDCADEIDIFEFFRSQNDQIHDRKISLSVHTELNCGNGPQNIDTENYTLGQSMATGMHTYSVDWDDFVIVFSVDGQVRRTLYHYYRRRWAGLGYAYRGVRNCQEIASNETYFYDPQFTDAMEWVIINAAVRNGAASNEFPRNFDLDYFALYEEIDCQETKVLHNSGDISGASFSSSYGDRTITAGQITVDPTSSFSLYGPPPFTDWNPGDLLILTASSEIRILPGFEVQWDANLIGQIRPCAVNKAPVEFEAISILPEPETLLLIGDSLVRIDDSMVEMDQNLLSFSLFPNPAFDKITISGVSIGDRIMIEDMMGRKVGDVIATSDFEFAIPIAYLQSGAYIITVLRSGKVIDRMKMICNH